MQLEVAYAAHAGGAIKEDEWLLYAHGAIMGFAGGPIHLWILGVAR